MRAWAPLAALALQLCLISPAAAQSAASEAESHVFSAFTSRADPRLLADDVRLGPALREQLGGESDPRKVYEALLERVSGRLFQVNSAPAADVGRYAVLAGGNPADPLVVLEAGEVALLLQYAAKDKKVAFVEQLRGPAAAAAAPVEALRTAPVVEVPLPTAPPPPPPPVPAVVEKPKPAPRAAEKPRPAPAPVAVQKPAPVAVQKPAPAPMAKPRPRGECVIKPVMSEEDMWNCSTPARPAPMESLAAPVAAAAPQPRAAEPPKPPAECVIKPVMSEEDLRACAAVRTSRVAPIAEPPPPAVEKAAPPPPAPKRECVIKAVMSEEDLRACGATR